MRSTHCFVDGLSCIDEVHPVTGKGTWSKKTLEEYKLERPDMRVMEWQEYITMKETAFCTDPAEITEDRFLEMLNVMYPDNWIQKRDESSFEVAECKDVLRLDRR